MAEVARPGGTTRWTGTGGGSWRASSTTSSPAATAAAAWYDMTRVMPWPAMADATAAAAELTTSRGRTTTGASRRPGANAKRQASASPASRSRMQAWSRSAAGAPGVPRRARYAGAAHSTRRTWPSRVVIKVELGSAPIRTATSMPSSTRLTTRSSSSSLARTSGYASRNASSAGRTCSCPNISGAVMVMSPLGRACSAAAPRSAASSAASTSRHVIR